MPQHTQTFRLLIDGQLGADGCFQTYWATADHLGHAIELAVNAAHARQLVNPVACEAAIVDEAPSDTVQLESNLYCSDESHLYPVEPGDDPFQYPVGIIPSDNGDDADPDEIHEAYAVDIDEKPFDVEVVVDRRRLESLFFSLVEKLPSASALEVRICGHWDNTQRTGIWLSPDWNSKRTVIDYLTTRKTDLFYSGFVEIAVYCRPQKCTLRIDDHKMIAFYSDSKKYLSEFVSNIERLGIQRHAPFLTIARGFHHYHYRPTNSLDRIELVEALESDGFRLVDSLADD